ncbi:MAG TPA: DUF1501 domain-containing protein [Methylomirabilota bacterium]|nr:DUF1501 domain-containing protein [Methylomirabilota bacterium]
MNLFTRNVPALSRRELLRIGGLAVAGGFLNRFTPLNVWGAEKKAQPRGTARQVLFINLEGGLSQVDSLDAKVTPSTPEYFDIRSYANDIHLPRGLFPNLSGILDKVSVVRSMAAWDAVHGRAQYYIQTGHPLNLALAKEVPAIGAVVCHELAKDRKSSDSLPPYIAMNMAGNQAGLINQGFLSAEFGPLSLAIKDGPPALAPQPGMADTMRRRWERLQKLDGSLREGAAGLDRSFPDYHEYYRGAWAIMNDPRVPHIFSVSDDDKKRYGQSSIGVSLALSRNLFKADAGTRFILASHGGWDHHGDIYKENTRNHPTLIRELDQAFSALVKDLESTPSKHQAGKTLLDETLLVCVSEFGRTPGAISDTRAGREHYIHVHSGMLAGGGIRKSGVIGKTDAEGGKVVDPGWSGNRPIYMEDLACTIYSAMGIDWSKIIENTPSGRAFHYVEPASGTKYMNFKPVEELFA